MDLNVSFIKSVLNLYDELHSNGISLVYLGEFNHQITKMFTTMADNEMGRNDEHKNTRKKVYHSMVETLQNMNKHSDEIASKNNIGKGLFLIGKKDNLYYIITANKVNKTKVPTLETAIREVNNSTPEELKEMYKKQLKEGTLSEKQGAGLGLIDIARKSTRELHYQFLPLDEDHFFFILKVEIESEINFPLIA
jgi:hypothetical protein